MRTERPALMSTEMVKAILAERKTKTRRANGLEQINENPDVWKPYVGDFYVDKKGRLCQKFFNGLHSTHCVCPYGQAGDMIWVRESFSPLCAGWDINGFMMTDGFCYKASFKEPVAWPWKPSIHMPKAAARIWLEITSLTVERLQDIAESDALEEGVESMDNGCVWWKDYMGVKDWYHTPKPSFLSLWRKINGLDSLRANPWVWVISFKVLSTTGRPEFLNQSPN